MANWEWAVTNQRVRRFCDPHPQGMHNIMGYHSGIRIQAREHTRTGGKSEVLVENLAKIWAKKVR